MLKFGTEPDVLKFPISLITVAALVEALVATRVAKEEYDTPLNCSTTLRRLSKYGPDLQTLRQKLIMKTENEIEGVVQDIQAIVGISDVLLFL